MSVGVLFLRCVDEEGVQVAGRQAPIETMPPRHDEEVAEATASNAAIPP